MPTERALALRAVTLARRRRPRWAQWTERLLAPAMRCSALLSGALLSGCLLAAEAVPEAMEPAVLVSPVLGDPSVKAVSNPFEPGLDAADGWQLDPTIFAEMEAYAVPITPLALPEDQREE